MWSASNFQFAARRQTLHCEAAEDMQERRVRTVPCIREVSADLNQSPFAYRGPRGFSGREAKPRMVTLCLGCSDGFVSVGFHSPVPSKSYQSCKPITQCKEQL